mmetsp:Transcript_18525/g.36347  ORF Transcript_18525/g.36347 Transcript_18525/m.36347 type:complete len:246 (-) Transcript_18525:188-925(-)
MPCTVNVNLYDLVPVKALDKGLRAMGTGAFHAGVAVYGREWSYGFSYKDTGIFACEPKEVVGPEFRESLCQGETSLSEEEVDRLISELKAEWIGTEYDLLSHNCCSFSNLFCEKLGVSALPSWVTNLAQAGATVCNGALAARDAAQRAAIIAAAKAGNIDEKYNIRGKAGAITHKAKDILENAQAAADKYQIREKAKDLAGKAQEASDKFAAKAKDTIASGKKAEPVVQGRESVTEGNCNFCVLL